MNENVLSTTKLKDIAEAAGVSIGTASRALRGKTKGHWASSAEQMERIRELAQKMGYRPNRAAQVMRTNRTYQVCVITSELYNPHTSHTVELMGEELAKHGYGLMLRLIKGKEDEVVEHLKKSPIDFVDAVIINHPHVSGRTLESCVPGVPLVTYDRSPEFSPVIVNMEGGALLGLQHLWNLGHRRIAMLTGGADQDGGKRRLSAFYSFYASQGQEDVNGWAFERDWTFESGEAAVDDFLSSKCTACITGNDLLGVGLATALRMRGYDVPGDFSLLSMDDTILTRINRPQLSSVRLPVGELVRLTVEGIVAKIEDKPAPEFRMLMPQLIVRESTGQLGEG
ncbi:MAG: LacI family DNA-binding transcriptional regulator [Verrucomicrobiales bacterium]